jgi:hypothetical protein
VIALHGCGGMYSAAGAGGCRCTTRRGPGVDREGCGAVPDSFQPPAAGPALAKRRSIRCDGPRGGARLARRGAGIDRDRIAPGSHGSTASRRSTRSRCASPRAQVAVLPRSVAFYPLPRASTRRPLAAAVPARIHIGANDD